MYKTDWESGYILCDKIIIELWKGGIGFQSDVNAVVYGRLF